MARTSWYKVPFIGHYFRWLTTAPMEFTAWDVLMTAGLTHTYSGTSIPSHTIDRRRHF